MPYEQTQVPIGQTQEEIKKLLVKFGAQAFRFTSFPSYALLEFVRKVDTGQLIPYRITVRPMVKAETKDSAQELNRAERQVWRVVYWWLKAKLEAIEFGLMEFEQEFLPHLLLSDGQGRTDTVDKIFFERLAGRIGSNPNDPFGGLRPALPEGGR